MNEFGAGGRLSVGRYGCKDGWMDVEKMSAQSRFDGDDALALILHKEPSALSSSSLLIYLS